MADICPKIYLLGIDWGEKRIGLAIGDSETKNRHSV
jgi:RNase H-fold protein (predicted Holliday junction resolvase)